MLTSTLDACSAGETKIWVNTSLTSNFRRRLTDLAIYKSSSLREPSYLYDNGTSRRATRRGFPSANLTTNLANLDSRRQHRYTQFLKEIVR